ncbi:MAG: hypothetical protein ACTSRZ_15645 [Promethearchaeota archaeon]
MISIDDENLIEENEDLIAIIGKTNKLNLLDKINTSGISPQFSIELHGKFSYITLQKNNYNKSFKFFCSQFKLSELKEKIIKNIKLIIITIQIGNYNEIKYSFEEIVEIFKNKKFLIPILILFITDNINDDNNKDDLFLLEHNYIKNIITNSEHKILFKIPIYKICFEKFKDKESFKNELEANITDLLNNFEENYLIKNSPLNSLEIKKSYFNLINKLYEFYDKNKSLLQKILFEIAKYEKEQNDAFRVSLFQKIKINEDIDLKLKEKINIINLWENSEIFYKGIDDLTDDNINKIIKDTGKLILPLCFNNIKIDFIKLKQKLLRNAWHKAIPFLFHIENKNICIINSLFNIQGILIIDSMGNCLAYSGFNNITEELRSMENLYPDLSTLALRLHIAINEYVKTKKDKWNKLNWGIINFFEIRFYFFRKKNLNMAYNGLQHCDYQKHQVFTIVILKSSKSNLDHFTIDCFQKFTNYINKDLYIVNQAIPFIEHLESLFTRIFPITLLCEINFDNTKDLITSYKENPSSYFTKNEIQIVDRLRRDLMEKIPYDYLIIDIIQQFAEEFVLNPSDIYPSIIDLIDRGFIKIHNFSSSKMNKQFGFKIIKKSLMKIKTNNLILGGKIAEMNKEPTFNEKNDNINMSKKAVQMDLREKTQEEINKLKFIENKQKIETNNIINSKLNNEMKIIENYNSTINEIYEIINNFKKKNKKKL